MNQPFTHDSELYHNDLLSQIFMQLPSKKPTERHCLSETKYLDNKHIALNKQSPYNKKSSCCSITLQDGSSTKNCIYDHIQRYSMAQNDFYKILGLTKKATHDEIKRAYRKLARKFHPDVSKDPEAIAKFQEITEAYEVLKDKEKRLEYDTRGSYSGARQENTSRSGQPASEDFSDIFSQFGRRHNQFSAEDLFSFRQQGTPHHQEEGRDLHAKITITLEDSYHGAKRTITLNRTTRQPNGQLSSQPQSLNVTIPKGIIEGQQIRLEGQGDSNLPGGILGNLFIEISFEPHPLFTLSKRDIYLIVPVTPWEAALGATISVPTLGGQVALKVPENSQTGKKLRLKNRGLSSKSQEGHQYVTLAIHTPPAKTDQQKELYQKMEKLMDFNPRSGFGG